MTNSIVIPVFELVRKLNLIKCAMGDSIKIYQEGDRIFAETFNNEIHARVLLVKGYHSPFTTKIVSSHLYTIISKMPVKNDITLAFEKSGLTMKCYSNTTRLSYFDINFPKIEEFGDVTEEAIWTIKDLDKILKKVSISASTKGEGVLTGINFLCTDKDIMIRTCDCFRVSQFQRSSKNFEGFPENINITIPTNSLIRIFEQLKNGKYVSRIFTNKITFNNEVSEDDHVTYILRLFEGKYPAVEKFIPERSKYVIDLDCSEMLAALERCSVFSAPQNEVVELKFTENELVLHKKSEVGYISEKIQIKEGPEQEICIALSIPFLKAAIKSFDSKSVDFCFTTDKKPVLIFANRSEKKEIDNAILQLILPVMVR